MRLDQYIARQLGLSRKHAGALIRSRRVRVGDAVVTRRGQHVRPGEDPVTLDGEPVEWAEHLTLMLHKPAGVVSATHDRSERTVLDLIDGDRFSRKRDLVCVGRLDKDTTGLLLLTTDGALVQRLTHPKHGTEKRYLARFDGELADDAASRVAAGLTLGDGTTCRPARLQRLGEGRLALTLQEGKYHQVKRMIAACGGHVTELHRASIGGLGLGDLAVGDARPLSAGEVEALQH